MTLAELELLLTTAAADPKATRDMRAVLERADLPSGPDALTGLRARPRDAALGVAARALVVADGETYAHWLPRGLADLSRVRGWHAAPPAADVLAFAANHALLDGMLAAVGAPEVATSPDGALVVTLTSQALPTGGLNRIVVTLPPDGAATWTRAAAPTPPAPIPIDAATGLERALASDDAFAILRALRPLDPGASERARRALASAAVLPHESIAAEALLKLAAHPDGRAAVRAALADVPEARRAAAEALALALLGGLA